MRSADRGVYLGLLAAWLMGAVLTGAFHVVQFGPLGSAWWFGLVVGALEGGLGTWMNRRGLQDTGPRGMAWALGGGLARLALWLLVWQLGVRAGWPERASALCMVAMYVVMMVAGINVVARYAGSPNQQRKE